MFERLAPFRCIIVTGPQRSGTTVAAAMIACDLSYWFYKEEAICTSDLGRARRLVAKVDSFVLQAPAICRWVHFLTSPTVAIVLMRRNIEDIVASEKRIRWHGSVHNKLELRQYGLETSIISEVKYRYWDTIQKHLIDNPFEIQYESLAAHPMWVPKEERAHFRSRQYMREGAT